LAEHVAEQAEFRDTQLKPRLDAAAAGQGHVFFVDAAHFVFGTFLGCLWSFTRIFVRAASGRQRFNVLGAWNAITRELVAVTNTTVVNTETMCDLLKKIAALGLTGPVTLVQPFAPMWPKTHTSVSSADRKETNSTCGQTFEGSAFTPPRLTFANAWASKSPGFTAGNCPPESKTPTREEEPVLP
jgi:hypothetical protein